MINIEEKSLENSHFREVLFTAPGLQLVVMSLEPVEEIGLETHDGIDQFSRVESGRGKALLNEKEYEPKDGLAGLMLIGSLLAGYGMESRKSRNWMHTIAFVVILALTVYVIRDLEFLVFQA